MKLIKLAFPCLIALSAACTPRPDSIAPVPMTGAFSSMGCSQAAATLATERQTLAALEAEQNRAATADAVGVFFVLVPVSKLTGGDKAGEVGTSKGKVLALEDRLGACG